ncbi:SDR family oxidoreductase [Pseudomonas sp. MAP12]|uniref:SDR family oxidoreductase n=1 Tax=Geopseudomonas aromaticivorans TaxID=2849492 RepID=A0ABS6MXT6_9GAMM|nr:SDR family oxidoreductase [Pseudomonas aromaticivorans]
MRVLVTGATGFVGRGLLKELPRRGHVAIATTRRAISHLEGAEQCFQIADMGADSHWLPALEGIEAVIHAAARVHVMQERSADPLVEYRRVNVHGTLRLARQAAAAGVRRFVFISSIKVNGEGTDLGKPYSVGDVPAPVDPYGISKLEAEQGLLALAAETGMEVVIIRPVLVYGPGVKANFRSMMDWLSKRIPLPLGAIHNKRSLVAVDNLVDLIVTCLEHPAAANRVFLVSDGEDLSTTELLRRMGAALNKPACLFPVPAAWLCGTARLFGQEAIAQRLCGSLQVDIGQTRRVLGWTPPVTVDEALRKTARDFLEHR